jgi:hypothetical protein
MFPELLKNLHNFLVPKSMEQMDTCGVANVCAVPYWHQNGLSDVNKKMQASHQRIIFCNGAKTCVPCINTSSTAKGGGGSFEDGTPIGEVSCYDEWMAEKAADG